MIQLKRCHDEVSNLPQRSLLPSVNFQAGSQPLMDSGFLRRGFGTVLVVEPKDVYLRNEISIWPTC